MSIIRKRQTLEYQRGYADAKKIYERKHGEWIYSTNNESVCEEWTCNLCGIFSLENTNFCPNCGADMRTKEYEPTFNQDDGSM